MRLQTPGVLLLEYYKIDDVVSAFPVHGIAGIWGTLAVALFGDLSILGTGLTRVEQLTIQGLGTLSCAVWSFGFGYVILVMVDKLAPLKVTAQEEDLGLNQSEHGVGAAESTESASIDGDPTIQTNDKDCKSPLNFIGVNSLRDALSQRPVLTLSCLASFAVTAILWTFSSASSSVTRGAVLTEMEQLAYAIATVRQVYTSEVVNRARDHLTVTHDYKDISKAIPLPATLTQEIGNALTNRELSVRLFSRYPFPWRKNNQLDEFESKAISKFESGQLEPYYEFVSETNGDPILRLAVPDLLGKQCVSCHNSHPDTPKRDWKEGDVRGAISIRKSLKGVTLEQRGALIGSFVVIGALFFLGLYIIALALKHLKSSSDELAAVVTDLEKARDDALEASSVKARFLANMSHEIRTPMNGILGMTELALDTKLDDTQRQYLLTVQSSGNLLLNIINDVLDFSKIESGKFSLLPTSIKTRALISQVIQLIEPQANRKDIFLVEEIDRSLASNHQVDGNRLQQVLINLLQNSVKFTDPGGGVLLMVTVTDQTPEAQSVCFSVVDSA